MLEAALSKAEIQSKALAMGFDTVGICPAHSPEHISAYREWLQKGYHGTMSYLE